MSFADLHSFVAAIEQRGWLKRVTVLVDPVLEITEIAERVTKAGGPALLFENVVGSDLPLLINTYGSAERMCLALGADSFDDVAARVKTLIKPEMPTTLMQKIRRLPELAQLGSLPPKIVKRGVCQEVVHTDDADLFMLPALKCWPLDGDTSRNVATEADCGAGPGPLTTAGTEPGRYITLGAVFTKDPETGERNIGMYRVQLFEPKLAAMHWHMHHDGARHFRKYRARGERMPVAIALGGPAVLPYAATCPLPAGIDEALFAGFLQGGSMELVPGVTQAALEVPATAEIVIEGYIDPGEELILEGPFGDHTGFYSLADFYPRLHVTAITHRQQPIYPATIVGKPPQEDYWLGKATERIFLPLLQVVVPDVIDYDLPLFGCFHNCVFVKIRKEYPYQARRVMAAIWGAGQMAFTKIIVVVDEHVNVHNQDEVLFQLCSNIDPRRDIMFIDGPLDILDHASPVCGAGSKMGIDATRKIAGEGAIRAWPDELEMSTEIKERVTRRWGEYGV
ncbi:MAG: UbiD family decarboxylase [Planctomycetes bacterium]|nr:UbiD family decarboxylase [Planctomycetota bacterium]